MKVPKSQRELTDYLRPYAEAVLADENFRDPGMAEAFLLIMGWFKTCRCDVFAGALRKLKVGPDYGYDAYHSKQRRFLRAMLERGRRNGILSQKDGKNLVAVDWFDKLTDPTLSLGIIIDCLVLVGVVGRTPKPVDGEYQYFNIK